MNLIDRKTNFINKSNRRHNFKYDYSLVNYIDSLTNVNIVCPIHGIFSQTPQSHARGNGCPQCSKDLKRNKMLMSTSDFIKKSNEIHKHYYDYSLVDLSERDENGKVSIICPKHGVFQMKPSSHLQGQKCPKCQGRGLTLEEIIKKANEIHNFKYDYSKIIYTKMHNPVSIICPIHGEFMQSLSKHISKHQGCPQCSSIERGKEKMYDAQLFFKKANKIHNFKYDYSNTIYVGMNKPIKYICPVHGEISQRAFDHLRGFGCNKCGNLESKNENELFNFLKPYFKDIEQGNRTILNGKELDIYIPSKQVAIEYNGLRWHSEEFGKDKWYHLNKTLECNNQNIQLIQIFEDEYINNKELVLNKIQHILKINNDNTKIMGRKCVVKPINKDIASKFLNTYHIQGFAPSTVYLGAFYEDKLIAAMTFKIESKTNSKWELNRFASDYNYICQGVGGKLFKWFIKNYNPSEIKSFADRRWTLDKDNNLYTKLGFKLNKILDPDYEYVLQINPSCRFHKFNFRKQILHKKYNLPLTMTEDKMTKELGYDRIWNCGLFKFVWKNKKDV